MKALQVLYTSCRRGQSPSSGFQIRSLSPGLSVTELQEITRLGNYRLPISASAEPARGAAPLGLRYRRLQSGRYALVHSAYAGRDYSGRTGNFMAHTLVPESGPLAARPTNFMNWTGWKSRLDDHEDTNEPPPPLPPVELADLPLDTTSSNREFIRTSPNGESVLTCLIVALLLLPLTGRRVVIRDTAERGWRWIAAAIDLLPLKTALEIAISTYQFDPTDAADMNATVEGSGFSFNASQRDFEFFVFEPATGLLPSFPDRDPELLAEARLYAKATTGWYLNDHVRLEQFLTFMNAFKACPADRPLVAGLLLFQGQASPSVDVARIIEFVRDYSLPGDWTRTIEALYRFAGSRSPASRFDDIRQIVFLCLTSGGTTDAMAAAAHAFDGWLELLQLALEHPEPYQADVNEIWKQLVVRFDPSEGYHRLLSEKALGDLRGWYRRASPQTLVFIAGYLVPALQTVSPAQLAEDRDLRELSLAAARSPKPRVCLAAIFAPLADTQLAALLHRLEELDSTLRPVLAQGLADVTRKKPTTAWALRAQLYKVALDKMLTAEFSELLTAGDRRGIYRTYLNEAAANVPEYHSEERDELTRIYWKSLSDSERISQALDWSNDQSLTDPDMLGELAIYANKGLSIDKDGANDAVRRQIAKIAKANGIVLQPDRPKIAQLLQQMAADHDAGPLLDESPELFKALRGDEYELVVEKILRQAWPSASTVNQHLTLIKRLYQPNFSREFATAFGKVTDIVLGSAKHRDILVNIILSCIKLASESTSATETAETMLDNLAAELAARRDAEEILRMTRDAAMDDCGGDKKSYDELYGVGFNHFSQLTRHRASSLSNSLRNVGRRLLENVNPFKRKR